MIRLRDAFFAVLLAGGCTPVVDKSNVPDAPVDAPDTAGPKLVSSNPEHMAMRISVLAPISLFFDEPLDPATVSATTVRLRTTYGYGYTFVHGTVTYDESGYKVSFVPSQPMYHGYRYEVVIDGVKDVFGNEFDGDPVRFITYVNNNTRNTYFNTNQSVNSLYLYQLDANGRIDRTFSIGGAGPDGVWYTADDVITCCMNVYLVTADGRYQEYRGYGQAGPDGKYGTADDILTSLQKFTFGAMDQTTEFASYTAGPDGTLGTSDDVVSNYAVYTYGPEGFMVGYTSYNHPGTDGVWRTADDRSGNYYEQMNDADGNRTRQIYKSSGADQIPRTADDSISAWYEYTYDSYGYQTRQVYRNSAGPDNMWFTADDVISFWSKSDRDARGLETARWSYNAPGPDGIWLTADDVVSSYTSLAFGPTKQQIEQTYYANSGPDNVWGTADDVVSTYYKFEYDTLGNRIWQRQYDAGLDGIWKNADDRFTYDAGFELTK